MIITDANGCVDSTFIIINEPGAPLSASITGTNLSAFGADDGSADLTVTGGTAPYTYLWSNGETTEDIDSLAQGTYTVTVTDNNGCTTVASVTIYEPGALIPVIIGTNLTCYNDSSGAADLSVSGGIAPYTIIWSNGETTEDIFNLPAGIYTVTVTDSNLVAATASVTITEPADITASITSTDVNCFGGNDGLADLTVAGGITPYSYLWSNSSVNQDISNVTAGIYSVTITDASGCTDTVSVTINQPASSLTASITGSNVSAFGGSDGSADLTVSGGTPGYTYNWSNGETTEDIINLTAGTYCVTVTDANLCTISQCITITQPASFLTVLIAGTDVSCNGESSGAANLMVSGGVAPYNYLWSTGDTIEDLINLFAGNYFVTVTDANSVTATASVTVNEPQPLVTSIIATNVSCQGGSNGSAGLTVTGGTIPYFYNWSNGNLNPDLYGVPQGIYSVTVTDSKGCTTIAAVNISEPAAGISITSIITNVDCFNSPSGAINITTSGGTPLYAYQWSNGDNNEDLDTVQAGTYSVTVTDINLCTSSSSFTITQPAALLSAYIVKTNPDCNGGSDGIANLVVNGGTLPYSYLWNNSSVTEDLFGITAGLYSVTVTDANNCIAEASTNLIAPPQLLIDSISTTDVGCYGGTTGMIDLSVSGGTMPFIYNWSNIYNSQDLNNIPAGTYYITVTDANNCSVIDSAVVNQPISALTANLSGTNILCYGNPTGAIDLTITGGTSPFAYYWNYGQTTEDLNNIVAGNYSVTVVDTNYCITIASVPVTQPPVITAILSANEILCNGDSTGYINLVVLGGVAPFSYLWNTSPPDTTNALSNMHGGTYTVTVTDANGCINIDSVTVIEPTSLMLGELLVEDVKCHGESTGSIAISFVQGGRPAYSYLWNNSQTASTIFNVTAGIYMLTVTDANGCTITASDTITEPDLSLSVSIVLPSVNCYLEYDAFIDLTVTGGTPNDSVPYYNYVWNYGQTTEDLDSIGPALYIVTITDANNCMLDTSMTIYSKPHISLIKTDLSCYEMNNGTIIADVGGGNLPFSYLWSTNDTTPVITNLQVGTYSLTVTDINNCADTAEISLSQPDSLYASIVVTDALCYGDSTGAINLSVLGGTIPYAYLWNSGHTSQDIMNVTAGVYTATVTDVNNCQAICDSIIISQPTDSLAINFNVTNVSCYGGTDGAIDATVTGGTPFYTYFWNYGWVTQDIDTLMAGEYEVTVTDYYKCKLIDSVIVSQPDPISLPNGINTTPASCGNTNGTAVLPNIAGGLPPYTWLWSNDSANADSIWGLAFGAHNIAVTDANGCIEIFNFSINLTGYIPLTITTTPIKCSGWTATATVTPQAGFTPFTYIWSDGQTDSTATGLIAGNYSVTVFDALNCIGTDTLITIAPSPSPLTVNYIEFTNVTCRGNNNGTVTVHIDGGTQFYGDAPYHYLWNDSLPLGTDSVITGLSPGYYSVAVTDSFGCIINASQPITEPAKSLQIQIDTIVDASCFNGSDGFVMTSGIGGTPPYYFTWSNGQHSTTAVNLTIGTYFLTISDSKGCDTTTFVTVYQPQLIVIRDSIIKTSCRDHHDGEIHLIVTGGTGQYYYNWNNRQITNPATGLVIGTYYVTVTDEHDCPMVDTIEIGYIQLECLTIPTAFTPNDDNYNDDWELLNIELYSQITIQIFNRWGDKVFDFDGSGSEYDGKRWNGTFNGRQLPIGPYMFIIDLHNDREPYAGTITIIR
ncbi:MAG: gliding motility-associated C-terminal domain-containing protein [Bacteroidia bacterium]|nr:gliding motility-associated C-terminal domain-containing protein [Bacteroidia bacterium]